MLSLGVVSVCKSIFYPHIFSLGSSTVDSMSLTFCFVQGAGIVEDRCRALNTQSIEVFACVRDFQTFGLWISWFLPLFL